MADLAKLIEVERRGQVGILRIDGEDFPWHIAEDGVVVENVAPGDTPAITVTILAEQVAAINSLIPPEQGS